MMSKAVTSIRCQLQRRARVFGAFHASTASALNSSVQKTSNIVQWNALNTTDAGSMKWMAAVGAMAVATSAMSLSNGECEASSDKNPIQSIGSLLDLYKQIDENMEIMSKRLLESLEQTLEEEKKTKDNEMQLSPQQRALNMSVQFESTLEKVQDSVFRNNYVSKEQVQEALQKMVQQQLQGSGTNGQISLEEAEALDYYVKRIERMRWLCTGSREPLIPSHVKSVHAPLEEKPEMGVHTIVQVMEEVIPTLTREMQDIVQNVRQQSGYNENQKRQLISKQYLERSAKVTEEICRKHKVDLVKFQNALMYYHDDPEFEKALAKLSSEQQQAFADLGL